jgi:hypothetical protein
MGLIAFKSVRLESINDLKKYVLKWWQHPRPLVIKLEISIIQNINWHSYNSIFLKLLQRIHFKEWRKCIIILWIHCCFF